MERNTQRINGSAERLHRYSELEIAASLAYAEQRVLDAQHDVGVLLIEQERRANSELPLGELATVHLLHPVAEVIELTPPAA